MQKLLITFVNGVQAVAYCADTSFANAIIRVLAGLAPKEALDVNCRLQQTMQAAGVMAVGEARAHEAEKWVNLPRHYTNTTHGCQTLQIAALAAKLEYARGGK